MKRHLVRGLVAIGVIILISIGVVSYYEKYYAPFKKVEAYHDLHFKNYLIV